MNAALKSLGEPEITSFTSSNILQQRLIEAVNNAERRVLGRHPFDWGLKRTTLTLTDDITDDSAAVTQGGTTVTSVDSDGVNADSFTGATTSMWFRRTSDLTSYEITAVDTASSPDTLTITPAYVGETTTASGYRLFQDTYSLSDADLEEIRFVTYGDGISYSREVPDNQIKIVSMSDIMYHSGGDLHRDTSGRPRLAAKVSVDSSDNPRIVLWPFPTDDYVVTIWYTIVYSENTTFATNLFSGDAPLLAYDAVEKYVTSIAYRWDKNYTEAEVDMQEFTIIVGELLRGNKDLQKDQSMKVQSFRRAQGIRWPIRSGIYFDTKSSFGR